MARSWICGWLGVVGVISGCSSPPEQAETMPVAPTGADTSATGDEVTSGPTAGSATTAQTSGADSGTGVGSGPTSGPGVADSDSGATSATSGRTTNGSTGDDAGVTSRGTDSGGVVGSTGGSTGAGVTLGFACENDSECDEAGGEECCSAGQCEDTCMIPCPGGQGDCPVGTGCAHGYCLFECAIDDDCATWPGYTCQHGNPDLCEND